METEREVKTIQVNLSCRDCRVILKHHRFGPYIRDIRQWYEYICPYCNKIKRTEKEYPYIRYPKK